MRPDSRSAFTLVEVLVAITIIGILVGLLIPAVNAAREAARRANCLTNVKQLATACLIHESRQGFLPTGGWGANWAGDPDRGFGKRQPGGWHYCILPYIEQSDLHDMGSQRKAKEEGKPDPKAFAKNAGRVRAQMPVVLFICPSRRKLSTYPYSAGASYVNIDAPQGSIGRSDYAACAGAWGKDTTKIGEFQDGAEDRSPNSDQSDTFDWSKVGGTPVSEKLETRMNGVICRASATPMGNVKDGSAFTYLLGERHQTREHYFDGQALDDQGGWDMGYYYDVNRWTFFPPARDHQTKAEDGALHPGGETTSYKVFGSPHANGFHMAFVDGSARRMSYGIDPLVHGSLGGMNDTKPTDLSELAK